MRCLAVRQPFAWLICTGHKRVENRTISTPFRGRVAIVASLAPANGRAALRDFPGGRLPADLFAYGAFIGAATLTDVVPLSAAVEDDPHAEGPLCWVFAEPKLFRTPIPTKGKLNLYHPTADERAALQAADAEPGVSPGDPGPAEFGRWLAPDPFDRVLWQADEYHMAQSMPDLERAVGRLLALDPAQPEPYFYRAVVAYHAGRLSDALADCTLAVELAPQWGRAYLARSDVHEALGDEAAADTDYTRAVELDPSLADPPE